MEKLKPCPFCGANANGPTDAWPHMIVCEGCGASVKGLGFAEDGMREAVRKWNRRAHDAKQEFEDMAEDIWFDDEEE